MSFTPDFSTNNMLSAAQDISYPPPLLFSPSSCTIRLSDPVGMWTIINHCKRHIMASIVNQDDVDCHVLTHVLRQVFAPLGQWSSNPKVTLLALLCSGRNWPINNIVTRHMNIYSKANDQTICAISELAGKLRDLNKTNSI